MKSQCAVTVCEHGGSGSHMKEQVCAAPGPCHSSRKAECSALLCLGAAWGRGWEHTVGSLRREKKPDLVGWRLQGQEERESTPRLDMMAAQPTSLQAAPSHAIHPDIAAWSGALGWVTVSASLSPPHPLPCVSASSCVQVPISIGHLTCSGIMLLRGLGHLPQR